MKRVIGEICIKRSIYIYTKLGCMEYNAPVCNHKYIQHEGKALGLHVLVVTHEYNHEYSIQASFNWFVA